VAALAALLFHLSVTKNITTMKSFIVIMSLFVCGMMMACNNAGESTQTTDSSTIQSTQDNTMNADTARLKDTSSYDRMQQKTDSSRKY